MPLNIQRVLEMHSPETSRGVVDLGAVRRDYLELRRHLPGVRVCCALEVNPNPDALIALSRLGAGFVVASPNGIELCLSHGVAPSRLSYGGMTWRACEIAFAYRSGVRVFIFEGSTELERIALHAPSVRVVCRIVNETADRSPSLESGCAPEVALSLLYRAREIGLEPFGVSFRVHALPREADGWNAALAEIGQVFERLETEARGWH